MLGSGELILELTSSKTAKIDGSVFKNVFSNYQHKLVQHDKNLQDYSGLQSLSEQQYTEPGVSQSTKRLGINQASVTESL